MAKQKIKVVTRAFILNEKKQVLLGKRANGKGINQWALVGGKPEGDETIEETVIREVNEELGLIFHPNFWKEEFDTISNPGEVWKVCYFWGPVEGELKLDFEENSEAMFVSLKDLEDLDIAFDHRKVLTDFFSQKIS